MTRRGLRSGRQGCLASEREPNSERERAWLGSNVGHHAGGRRSGSSDPRGPNTAARDVTLARQGWIVIRRKSGHEPAGTGGGSPATVMLCDRERQRSRCSVWLSQPKGAEGLAADGRSFGLRRAAPYAGGRSSCGEFHRVTLAAEAAARTAQPALGEPTQGDDDARRKQARGARPRPKGPQGDAYRGAPTSK